jgi:hypothetical protein
MAVEQPHRVTPGQSMPFKAIHHHSSQRSTSGHSSSSSSSSSAINGVHFEMAQNLPPVSKEDMYLAMLGHKDLLSMEDPHRPGVKLFREEFCGACGVIHPNPAVLDVYGLCPSCFSELRPGRDLREKMRHERPRMALDVLFATYGDPEDILTVQVVTQKCIERVQEARLRDRMAFTVRQSMNEYFEFDPAPGKNKQLRMRYRMDGVHGTLVLDFDPAGRIPQPFLLMAPKKHFVRLYEASYGHPKGATSTGRMHYDVQEVLQSMIDQNGGSYLSLSAMTPLTRLLGDPCPGYCKDLRINFEIVGRGGRLKYKEVRGHLVKRINIFSAPTIAPIMFVVSATYGVTPTTRRDRLESIAKDLRNIASIEHRQREGLPVQVEELAEIRNKSELLRLQDLFRNVPIKFVDVASKVQKIADIQKTMLSISKADFDPNFVFGNPLIGCPKILEVSIDCQGHDSEKITSLDEMMDTGYTRNFITMKKARFNIVVEDDMTTGKGIMAESIHFAAEYVSPMLIVTKATYGELDDLTKLINVTNEVQGLVKGPTLIIERELNLNKYFKVDPSPGRQKELAISYLTRGFTGNLRVREKQDLLFAGVELGYPPIPPPDDENHIIEY